MSETNRYYYNQMNKTAQQAYHAMLSGVQALAPTFPVPKLSTKELSEIWFLMRLDNPELFYCPTFTYQFYQNAETVLFTPEYLFKKKQIQEHQKAMAARVQKLTRPVMDRDEKEKEKYIHDFICGNIHYDKLKKAYSHEIIGALGQGVAVCEGIAKAVKILCDRLNIWCIIALSENNPDKGIKYRHAWNIVRIGGRYYHLDATFDNSLGRDGSIRYDYYNLGDTQIFRDHEPVIWPVPLCTDHGNFYYKNEKLSFTKMEDLGKRVGQYAKKGKPFVFQWRGSYLTREVLQDIMNMIREETEKKGKFARISLNWPQAVFSLRFDAQEASDQVTMEEANEGEQEEA